MSEATLHGKPIKIGDRVWDSRAGWSTVEIICLDDKYPIRTENASYKETGFRFSKDEFPSLFWKEQSFDLTKPLPNLKVDDKIIVGNVSFNEDGFKRHFCKFDENGNAVVFNKGQTSWSNNGETSSWKHWKLPDDLRS